MANRTLRRGLRFWVAVVVLLPVLAFAVASVADGEATATIDLRLLVGNDDAFVSPVPPTPARLSGQAALLRSLLVLEGACRRFPQPPPNAKVLSQCASTLGRQVRVVVQPARGVIKLTVSGGGAVDPSTQARAVAESWLASSAADSTRQLTRAVEQVMTAKGKRSRQTAATALIGLSASFAHQTILTGPAVTPGHPLTVALIAAGLSILGSVAILGWWHGQPAEPLGEPRDEPSNEAIPSGAAG